MFAFFIKKSQEEQVRRKLFNFLTEMEKNLEFFFVCDQRQFITQGFLIEAWGPVKDMENIRRYGSIVTYAGVMKDFNHVLKEYKEFEEWYSKDINHRVPENARKLHAMKHALDSKLKTMEAVIILAGQDLERELLQMGLLKA